MTSIFKSDLLAFRYPANQDAERIFEHLQEKEIAMNLGRMPWPYQLEDAHWWIKHTQQAMANNSEHAFVIIHPDDQLIGSVALVRIHIPVAGESSGGDFVPTNYWEIGYWLAKPFWGRGIITQSANAMLGWARDNLDTEGFVSGHMEDNPASGRILKKLGFEEVGVVEHYARGRDCQVRALRYSLGAPAKIALDTSRYDDVPTA